MKRPCGCGKKGCYDIPELTESELKRFKASEHKLRRCLVGETQIFGTGLSMRDFDHADEICIQMYMDVLGHGINSMIKRRRHL